eukprot:3615755-Pleurochrysis_carterae.AAC.1
MQRGALVSSRREVRCCGGGMVPQDARREGRYVRPCCFGICCEERRDGQRNDRKKAHLDARCHNEASGRRPAQSGCHVAFPLDCRAGWAAQEGWDRARRHAGPTASLSASSRSGTRRVAHVSDVRPYARHVVQPAGE